MPPDPQTFPPLLRRLRRWTPYHRVAPDQPLFVHETRGIPWAASPQHFAQRTAVWCRVVWATLAVVLLLLFGASRYTFLESLSSATIIVAVSGWLMGVLLDMRAILNSLDTVRADVLAGRWELLRLTPLTEGEIILAKHAAAQMQSWHLCMVVVAWRAAVLLPIGVLLLSLLTNTQVFYVVVGRRWPGGSVAAIGAVTALITLVLMFESVWRLRAMTALGMWVSARAQDSALSIVSAFGGLIAIYIGGLGLLFGLNACIATYIFSLLRLLIGLLLSSPSVNDTPNPPVEFLSLIMTGTFLIALNAIGLYFFYRILQDAFLRATARRVDRAGEQRGH